MHNEVMMGCPECSMASSMSSILIRKDDGFCCSCNPQHRYVLDSDGMLRSRI